jgi:cytochrome c551/c552
MTSRFRLLSLPVTAFGLLLVAVGPAARGAEGEVGPFFEPGQPFHHTQAAIHPDNFVVRGVLLPLASGHVVLFDQELLRVAAIWQVPAGSPPVSLQTMAQISYRNPRAKVYSAHPQPTGPLLLSSAMLPGAAASIAGLASDPRPPNQTGDLGRGPLPAGQARYDGLQLTENGVVLAYHIGTTQVREWFEPRAAAGPAGSARILRHFEIAPHPAPLFFALGRKADGSLPVIGANLPEVQLAPVDGQLVATVSPSEQLQRFTLTIIVADTERVPPPGPTPAPPSVSAARRWPGEVTVAPNLAKLRQNGWVLDHVPVPEANPWQRRIRPADLAFFSDDSAAVVTYDGDVWKVDGLADAALGQVTWRRYAAGLHEPLAIAAPSPGLVQVWTKNGLVRLHDTDGNGEADRFENFNDQVIQSQSTRSFPLDMAIGPDGSTYLSQGGIVDGTGIRSGGAGTPHAGAILKISPDGRSSAVFARAAREPFFTVHPRTGMVTGTDQQGNYIPASVSYLIREGDSFGFNEDAPAKLTPPLVWIPHAQDTSSSSQVWTPSTGFGAWSDRLLHLSYGRGRLFAISPDLHAPIPQGAAIPLGLETDLPLLHGRTPPSGGALWFAGFQIWGTRTKVMWALGRLRADPESPIVTPVAARSNAHGVMLEFARPLAPASVIPANVGARAWDYRRSAEYGSGYFTLDGNIPGTTAQGVSQTVLSADARSVFIHLPMLTKAMQLEVRHNFQFADGGPAAPGAVYFTIHQPRIEDLAEAGFGLVDLSRVEIVAGSTLPEEISADQGRELAVQFGCAACHFPDPTTQTTLGPTWRRLFGSEKRFADGTTGIANEAYLKEKILQPQKRKLEGTAAVDMPSYAGVLTDSQIESLILYIIRLSGQGSTDRPPGDQ